MINTTRTRDTNGGKDQTMEENEVLEQEFDLSADDEAIFDESWDEDAPIEPEEDGDGEPETAAEEPEDAQPETQPEDEDEPEESEEAPEPEQETEAGNQRFKINYLGKEEELSLEQMTELAQKGRDYDHVRQERDQLKSASADTDKYKSFLEDLAKRSGLSVDEQIDRTRALWLQVDESDKGNEISEAEALLRVQRSKGEKKDEKKESSQGITDINPQVDRFLKVYPNVPATDIPKEVWEEAANLGGDLLAAYQAYEIKSLREENARQKGAQSRSAQNEKNENRSTGSRRSVGTNRQRDEFDEGWDS